MKNRYLQLSLLLLAGFLFLAGCAQLKTIEQIISPVASPPPPEEPHYPSPPPEVTIDESSPAPAKEKSFTHKVRWSGETLSRISWWYTGSGKNWPAILEKNPTLDPRRIMIGDVIIIPEYLLKTREPMAEDYRTPGTIREKLEQIAPTLQAPAPQNVELFGPIDTTEQSVASEDIEDNLPLESLE